MVHHRTSTEPLHYMSHHMINHHSSQKHQTMIAAEEAILTQTLVLLSPLLIFGRTPKFYDTAVWFFSILPCTEDHIYMLTYSTVIFCLLFGCPKTNFGSLWRGQPQSPNFNYYVSMIFDSKVTGNIITMRF